LLVQSSDSDRIAAMAEQGIRDDEWRLQRIRPFDWYSVDYKRQAQRELQAKYWRLWSIEVRCYRRAGRPEKAAELLTEMDQRTKSLHSASDPVYWDALAMLVRLYEEGNQKDLATQRLRSMQDLLAAHPDPRRSAQFEDLRKPLETSTQK
jgi:pentatricopeptide repeat protein